VSGETLFFCLFLPPVLQVSFCSSRGWVVWRRQWRPTRELCWELTGALTGLRCSHVRLKYLYR